MLIAQYMRSLWSSQYMEQNDQLLEKVKELNTLHKEQESRADELERDLKSLNEKYTSLESTQKLKQCVVDGSFPCIVGDLDVAESKYQDAKDELEKTLEELGDI